MITREATLARIEKEETFMRSEIEKHLSHNNQTSSKAVNHVLDTFMAHGTYPYANWRKELDVARERLKTLYLLLELMQ